MPFCKPDRHADIAIVGAGPAGCAAGLALRGLAPDLTTVLIEAEAAPRPRPGEVLPAAGFEILHQLGVAGAVAASCRPAPGLASCWGKEAVTERAALLSARGADQHLDRIRFDALLTNATASAGVALRTGVAVIGAVRDVGGWSLSLSDNTIQTARVVIWATGRGRGFLRWVGAKQQAFGRLVGYMRYFTEISESTWPTRSDPRTLLEAAPDGWWYSAALPNNERAVVFMTDGDIGRRMDMNEAATWHIQLGKARLIRDAVGPEVIENRTETRYAGSSLIHPVCGSDWIAAGDAASCFEPLASQGIAKALRSGCFAAYAAFDILSGRAIVARARYDEVIRGEFDAYQHTLASYYAMEQRWAEQPFWARRHA